MFGCDLKTGGESGIRTQAFQTKSTNLGGANANQTSRTSQSNQLHILLDALMDADFFGGQVSYFSLDMSRESVTRLLPSAKPMSMQRPLLCPRR